MPNYDSSQRRRSCSLIYALNRSCLTFIVSAMPMRFPVRSTSSRETLTSKAAMNSLVKRDRCDSAERRTLTLLFSSRNRVQVCERRVVYNYSTTCASRKVFAIVGFFECNGVRFECNGAGTCTRRRRCPPCEWLATSAYTGCSACTRAAHELPRPRSYFRLNLDIRNIKTVSSGLKCA